MKINDEKWHAPQTETERKAAWADGPSDFLGQSTGY